jgi:prepilin-type N-terminal cleavage/methylation domain-containing protein
MRLKPRAFTLVELLIVAAIVGTIAAISLVAIQSARETSRRISCGNNFRQFGLALQSYSSGHSTFPPAVIWTPAGEPLGQGILPIGVIDRVAKLGKVEGDRIHASWVVMLLPHLDQQPLYQQFDTRFPIGHSRNAHARKQELAVARCPSDAYNVSENHFFRGQPAGLNDNEYARGNVAMNVGPDSGCLEGMGTAIRGQIR